MHTNSVEYFKTNKYSLPDNVSPPILVAWHLRTPENYGNLIRLADTIGASKVVFVGTEEGLSQRKIRKTAGNSYQSVQFCFVSSDDFLDHIPSDYELIALETATGSENIYKSKLPLNLALVVGNEKSGIDPVVLSKCTNIVHIPLTGQCTSLNVSHASAVAIFEWLRQILLF